MEHFIQITGILIALYGAYNAWRANRRIDIQESLNITPEIDDDTGSSMVALNLKIYNPFPEVVSITRIDVSPAMHGATLPEPTPNCQHKINGGKSIRPGENTTFILYYDEEQKKLEQYSVKIHYLTSRGQKKITKKMFLRD